MNQISNFLVQQKWAYATLLDVSFFGHPALLRYTQQLITGDPEKDIFEWSVETHMAGRLPLKRAVSLACGHGHVERQLANLGVFEECLGLDLAPRAIEEAQRLATEAGLSTLRYEVADINSFNFEPESVDLFIAVGALHHLKSLPDVIARIYKALRPNGFLIANEYVGPDYWQVTPRQYELINAMAHLIPSNLRERFEHNYWPSWLWPMEKLEPRFARRSFNPLKLLHLVRRKLSCKPTFGRLYDPPPHWYWLMRDPSEGIHASQILPLLRQYFSEIDLRPYNGTILHYALDQAFYERYDDANPDHRQVLQTLCMLERSLIDLEEVPSITAHLVARKTVG